VIITGASSGFGEACARRFAEDDCRLVLLARSGDKLRSLKDELEKKGAVQVFAAPLDVRDRAAIDRLIETLPHDFRQFDVLVNNAGLALGLESADQASLEDWETMIDTNIKGLLYMTKAVLSGMVERNRGHIINIGSIAGNWPYPGGNVYGATKAFVQQFSRNLRADLLGSRIRVTNIEPGIAETNFSIVRMKGDTDRAASVYAGTEPLLAEDIAEAVFWCSSLPERVNINTMEIMPTSQAWGPLAVHRSNRSNYGGA